MMQCDAYIAKKWTGYHNLLMQMPLLTRNVNGPL